jgi:hypothetical protein
LKDKAVRIIKYIAIIALIIVLGLQCLPVLESYQFSFRHGIKRHEWVAFIRHVGVYSEFYGFAGLLPELEIPEATTLKNYDFVLNTNAPNLYTSTAVFSDSTAILVHGNESGRPPIGYYTWICFRSGRCGLFEISPPQDKDLEYYFYDINELSLPKSMSKTDDIDFIISVCWNHFHGITNEFVSVRPYYRYQPFSASRESKGSVR